MKGLNGFWVAAYEPGTASAGSASRHRPFPPCRFRGVADRLLRMPLPAAIALHSPHALPPPALPARPGALPGDAPPAPHLRAPLPRHARRLSGRRRAIRPLARGRDGSAPRPAPSAASRGSAPRTSSRMAARTSSWWANDGSCSSGYLGDDRLHAILGAARGHLRRTCPARKSRPTSCRRSPRGGHQLSRGAVETLADAERPDAVGGGRGGALLPGGGLGGISSSRVKRRLLSSGPPPNG